jgi:geranylgeranyl diphosphate synthase type I
MARNKDQKYNELYAIMEERSKKVLERFGQTVVSGVGNSELLLILEDVKGYWKDFLRPALASFSCEAVGGQPEIADDVSLTFTLVAAGIGIHDDIIDKSLRKHFRRTTLGHYGLDKALLVGDFLIVKGWTMIHEMIGKIGGPTKIAEIAQAYGSFSIELCQAEFMEISCRQKLDIDLEYLNKILWKTSADMEACAKLGAILGDGSENEVRALAEFGRRLGFMLRLADDVHDMEENLPHRLKYESVPLPLLYAAKSSKENYLKIKSLLEKKLINSSDIKELFEVCFATEAFTYVRNIAKKNEREANRNLRVLRRGCARNVLALMIEKSFADVANLCL